MVTFLFPGEPYAEGLFQPDLERRGDSLVFKAAYDSPLTCAGGTPTVFNTDRIDLVPGGPGVAVILYLDLSKGPLAPGASPETSKPEIELESTIPDISVSVTPTDKSDNYVFGALADGAGANLNAKEATDDVDIALPGVKPPRRYNDFIFEIATFSGQKSNGGADVYSAAGGAAFTGPFPYNVLFVGGSGKDRLTGGPANDTIYGGEGRDVLAGGKGNDRINSLGAQRDRVDCGPGTDLAEATDRDIVENCERIASHN